MRVALPLLASVCVGAKVWPCTEAKAVGKYRQEACDANCQTALSQCQRNSTATKDNAHLFSCVLSKLNTSVCELHTTATSSTAPARQWYKNRAVVSGAAASAVGLLGLAGYGAYRQRRAKKAAGEADAALTEGAYYNKEGVLVDEQGRPVDLAPEF